MFHAASSPASAVQSPAPAVPSPRPKPEQNSRPAPSGKQRDAFFDNAKYLAIVLVAMGHTWDPLNDDSRGLQGLYLVLYTFHMPAFIIVSGYFSRSFDMRPDRVKRLVTGVAVPYVLFEIAYSVFKRVVDHDPGFAISLLDPWYLTWFLCALFVWRLTTPIWKVLRRPLPVALGVAMLASMTPEIRNDLDMQRVLQFLPCFVLGLCLRREHFEMVRRRAVRVLSVPVVLVALAVGWWAVPYMDTRWVYRSAAAQEMGMPWWAGPVVTLALFGCSLVLTACFFAWVPGRRMWFTALGAGTLYGYLLHGFVTKTAAYEGWLDHAPLHQPLGQAFVSLMGAVAVTLLCTGPVRRTFRFAMEPRMEWAFRPDTAGPAPEPDRSGKQRAPHARESVSA
ncbi:acyltransferase family protein [Streptomyces sp. NPDC005931]|uniref:acyltransferase family protein n=1 Tax=Streptomyces sp. NPDC005931 TaxID=3364737 RepID=UPI0036BDF684